MHPIISSIFLILCSLVNLGRVEAADNAVILLYHHVSAQTPASTSVSPQTFAGHMAFLAEHYRVLPLAKIVSALQQNQPLPDNAIAITFDDGYQNIYQNGHPILSQFNLPYTVFINPALVGKADYHLSWQQMRDMGKQGASFANHHLHHQHLLSRLTGEDEAQWLARIEGDILEAQSLLQQNLGSSLKYFAYPYGEYNLRLKQRITELGFVGFAQHSGAIASYSDFSILPRFPAAGSYANLADLKVKMSSLAMPVSAVSPDTPILNPRQTQPTLSFTLNSADIINTQLTCYYQGQVQPVKLDDQRITIRLTKALTPGRSRLNCTAPSVAQPGRYYWYSKPWFLTSSDETWLD